jgi:hypothetical protein
VCWEGISGCLMRLGWRGSWCHNPSPSSFNLWVQIAAVVLEPQSSWICCASWIFWSFWSDPSDPEYIYIPSLILQSIYLLLPLPSLPQFHLNINRLMQVRVYLRDPIDRKVSMSGLHFALCFPPSYDLESLHGLRGHQPHIVPISPANTLHSKPTGP